jgi:hypothetical protein
MAHVKKQKGDIGVTQIIADLTAQLWNVSLPITEHAKYDLIAEKNGIMIRVQCRFTTAKNGALEVKLASCWSDKNGCHVVTRQQSDYDVLGVYCPETDRCYYVSVRLLRTREC